MIRPQGLLAPFVLTLLAMVAHWPAALAAGPWRVEASSAEDQPDHAVVVHDNGARLAVYRDASNSVQLEFTTPVLGGLSRTSCPTFQIDKRTPQHFYPAGAGCVVDGASARYTITSITSDTVTSLVLYRLINGSRIAFRYLSGGGTYHQDVFSLSQSKQALLGALGQSLSVEPGDTE